MGAFSRSRTKLLAVALAASVAVAMASVDATGGAERPISAALPGADDDDAARLQHDGRSPVGRWRSSFAAFARSDRLHPPTAGGVVVVGSSSVTLWQGLESRFPAQRIVRRGFGGSGMADCARHADRLVLPHRPRQVVVYAGDNDLAQGASPADVLAAYQSLVRQVHAALPDTRIAFISVKPSPLRAALLPLMRTTNALVADYTRSDPRLDYIDVHSRMLDAAGRPRAELFAPDALHLNAAGYAVWTAALGEHLQ